MIIECRTENRIRHANPQFSHMNAMRFGIRTRPRRSALIVVILVRTDVVVGSRSGSRLNVIVDGGDGRRIRMSATRPVDIRIEATGRTGGRLVLLGETLLSTAQSIQLLVQRGRCADIVRTVVRV